MHCLAFAAQLFLGLSRASLRLRGVKSANESTQCLCNAPGVVTGGFFKPPVS